MTDNKNNKPDENESSDDKPNGFSFDGDLGFASDEDARILGDSTDKDVEDLVGGFIPADKPNLEDTGFKIDEKGANEAKTGAELGASDTWVPELNGIPEEQPDPLKTWVPTDTPTASGIDSPHVPHEKDDLPVEEDVNKTWVPSSTPTFNGIDDSADADTDHGVEAEAADSSPFEKTWVSPSASRADRDSAAEEAEEADPNKTYVPSSTPTFDGVSNSNDADVPDEPEIEDVDKTWVPSKTPTHHEFSFDQTEAGDADSSDPNKTWVPSDTPTADGLHVPTQDDDDDADGGKKTVVIPERIDNRERTGTGTVVMDSDAGDTVDPADSANAGTVVANIPEGINRTVFSKTISRRSSDEDDGWLRDSEEKNGTDTDVFELPEETIPGDLARSTQIWSHQSDGGLAASLTIRNAPVVGESTFEDRLKTDQPDYQIIKKLAEGGMGAIYVAKQTSLGRELAIKTLKPLRASEKKTYQAQGRMSQVQKQRREMFLSEALVTGNLVHPHIIPIHDLCQAGDDAPFYSMKRVHGTPWNESIQEMSLEENLEVLHKVCDAIAYAHHNGVVNRDLKPENVMLGEFGEVLVLDWGLAVPATKDAKAQFASPAAPFGAGTPAYMSPELWTGPAEAIGVWSDIYLLGAILFEAITGESPHEFPEPDSRSGNTGLWMVIDKVVRKNKIRETHHTGELMDIAMKAMSGSPKQRHLTVLEFQEAVKEYQKHEESRYLTARADQSLDAAISGKQQQGYQNYQTAAALYEEAHVAWPENPDAKTGLRKTRLHYAGLAHQKGDYDLGLQVAAQEQGEDFGQLTQKLTRSRRIRNGLKTAMVTAIGIVVTVGTIAAYQAIEIGEQNVAIKKQNAEIKELYGDKQTLETLAVKAELARDEAAKAEEQAKNRAIAAAAKAVDAEKRSEEADKALMAAKQQQKVVEVALTQAENAKQLAIKEKTQATEQLGLVKLEIDRVEQLKIRAGMELQSTQVATKIRSGNYAVAEGMVERLLEVYEKDPEFAKLPEEDQKKRKIELTRQLEQLRKRNTKNDNPVQAQLISPSGKVVVLGDDQGEGTGSLTVWNLTEGSEQLPETPVATRKLNSVVSAIRISEDEKLIVAAAGNELHFWSPETQEFQTLTEHSSPITTLRMKGDYLLTADQSGKIQGWDRNLRKPLWSIKSSSSIRDLELLAGSNAFLYAGSRGGQSADILAYQLPPADNPTARPKRMGQLRLPRDKNDPPRRIVVSPDESLLLISNSRNGEVIALPRLQNAKDAATRFPFVHASDMKESGLNTWIANKHQRPVNDMAFSANGRRVATASDDRTIVVWELTDNNDLQFVERLEGHGARVNSVGFLDADGRRVLSASADRYCRFWNVDRYRQDTDALKKAFNIESNESGILIPRRSRLSQTTPAKNDQANFRPVQQTDTKWIPVGLDLPADEPAPLGNPVVINANSEVQRGALSSVVLSQDGSRVVTGAADGTAVIWDAETGNQIKGVSTRTNSDSESGAFDEGHEFNVARLRFLPPTGNVLMTTGFDGTLCLWDANTKASCVGRQELRIPGLGLVNAIATSIDGSLLVTSAGTDDDQRGGSATIWETASLLGDSEPKARFHLTGYHRSEVSAIAVSRDGQMVATGARDGRVAVWDSQSGSLLAGGQIHAKNTIVSHLQWMPDDSILSAGFDGRISISEVAETMSTADRTSKTDSARLKSVRQFKHDRIPVERLAVSPSQDHFVSISVRTDKATKKVAYELELWNLQSTAPVRRIRPATVAGRKPDRIVAISWSQNGDRLAAVVDDNLQIFETANWKITSVLEAPGLGISDAVFAPENMDLEDSANIIATFDGTASHLWNLKTRTHLADFRPLFAVKSTALVERENASLLLTGDRAVRVFQADEDSPAFGETLCKISDPHRGVVTGIQFSPVGKVDSLPFVSSGADGSVALRNWNQSTTSATFAGWLRQAGDPIVSVRWNCDGTAILVADESGKVEVFTAAGQPSFSFQVQATSDVQLQSAVFSADAKFIGIAGQIIQSGESYGWVYQIQDVESPELHCTISGGHEAGGIRDIRFLPDSSYLVTGGTDGAALIWNWQPSRAEEGVLAAYEAYQLLADDQPRAHDAPIVAVDVSSGTNIATACEDGTAVIWPNPFAISNQ